MQGFGTIKVNDICSIDYKVINAWSFELEYKTPFVEAITYDKKIVKIESFGYSITLGKQLELNYGNGVSHFRIHNITTNGKNKFLVETTKPTKTKHFLLPILGKNREFWNYNTWLINAYLNNDLDEILLEYRFSTNDKYLEFEKSLRLQSGFYKITELTNSSTIYHYKVPDKKLKDIERFVQGKYSEFSESTKKSILSYHNFKEDGQTFQILYKSDKRRKQLEMDLGASIYEHMELYDIPLLTEEILIL